LHPHGILHTRRDSHLGDTTFVSADLGLRLHHVGNAVSDLEAAAELYVRRFGYRILTGAIHDAGQTARVQFLRLEGDSVYFELVSPDRPESKLTNAVKRGGGLNHLCYTCGPMEAVIAALESTGMKLISGPRPGVAFGGRRICWLLGQEPLPIELVERRDDSDLCAPGIY
jgi:methylmalonyl-CoA/ethylmalonyl-CoA epimerase